LGSGTSIQNVCTLFFLFFDLGGFFFRFDFTWIFRLKLQERSNIAGNGRESDGDSTENKNESKIADLMYRLRKEAGLNIF